MFRWQKLWQKKRDRGRLVFNKSKSLALFGCDFDANPDIESIRRKIFRYIAYEGRYDYFGPYDLLEKELRENAIFRLAGKYPCPTWLSASPDNSVQILPEMFRHYINDGGCNNYVSGFGNYVNQNLLPGEVPVICGVDHSVTGGLVKAISEKRTNSFKLLVFDAHLDAIPGTIRNELLGYARDNPSLVDNDPYQYEYFNQGYSGAYDAGSFLYWLIKEKVIAPEDLIIIGIQDEPVSALREIKDPRVKKYIDYYDSLLDSGVTVVPMSELSNREELQKFINTLRNKINSDDLYVSIDLDVFGHTIATTRYVTNRGLSQEYFLHLFREINKHSNLIGMDVTELDISYFTTEYTNKISNYISFMKNIFAEIYRKETVFQSSHQS